MMVHHLLTALPGRFLGAVPVYGLPLLGYLAGSKYELLTRPAEIARTSVFALHDRSDEVIPWNGGASKDGWYYEPLRHVLGAYAAVHGCAAAPEPTDPMFPDNQTHIACFHYPRCRTGRVRYCMYDGSHGDDPAWPAKRAWHFFQALEPHATSA